MLVLPVRHPDRAVCRARVTVSVSRSSRARARRGRRPESEGSSAKAAAGGRASLCSDDGTSRRGGAGQGRECTHRASTRPVRGTVRAHLFGEETGGTDSKVRAGGESTERVMLNSPQRQGATTLSLSRRHFLSAHSRSTSLFFFPCQQRNSERAGVELLPRRCSSTL